VIRRLTPARYLALANAIGAACTFVAGVYQARVLGPEQLGVMAVIAGVTVPAFILVDVRLNDVAARAFYAVDGLPAEAAGAYRAGVLWLAWLGGLGLGLLAALAVSLVGGFIVPAFTRAPVAGWWLPADALGLALSTSAGALFYLLRFSREFHAIGHWRILTQAAQMAVTLVVLTLAPTLGGAFVAGVAGGLIVLLAMLAVSWRIWAGRVGLPLGRPDWRRARAAYRQSLGMLFYGNALGYGKLLHRGLDVLAVAYFTGDRETGLYKLARQVVDGGIAILQDALYQVYFPDFLDLAARRAADAYRALARRLAGTCAGITAAVVAAEALLLPELVPLAFGADFAGAEWPMIVMTPTFFFIAGCHPWLWALFVDSGRLGAFTAATFLAVAAQYATMLCLFSAVGPTAVAGMTGLLAYYLCLVPVAYAVARRRFHAFLPGPGAPGASGPPR
jgi:O-antigen/teichoic acid export membrane protein